GRCPRSQFLDLALETGHPDLGDLQLLGEIVAALALVCGPKFDNVSLSRFKLTRRGLPWPLAGPAVGAGGLLQLGNFPSCFLLLSDGAHRLVVGLRLLGDLPVGLLRLRLDQLGDQIALLLGSEVPAVDVLREDKGNRIKAGGIDQTEKTGQLDAGSQAGAIAVAPVEDLIFIEVDFLVAAVRLDVGDERVELLALHQWKDVGERVELEFSRPADAGVKFASRAA